MKYPERVSKHIIEWITKYLENSKMDGLVVGVSGGIDSALTSTLCAETGKNLILPKENEPYSSNISFAKAPYIYSTL